MAPKSIKAHFRRFYPGFEPLQFWIPFVEESIGKQVVLSPESEADVVFTSVFESRSEMWKRRLQSRLSTPSIPEAPRRKSLAAKSIWVTGENVRPPARGYDLTASFDLDEFGGTNVYLPLILTELDWFSLKRDPQFLRWNSRTGIARLRPQDGSLDRQLHDQNRLKFACAFVGNAEPIRMRAIRALESVGQVDVFGSAVGRPVASKFEIAQEYRFMLCFESDLYPGYVTEKVLEAYQCGCIPLWRGVDAANLLNPKALVNEHEFATLDKFASYVANLYSREDDMFAMSRQALFLQEPRLDTVAAAIQRLLTV